MTKYRFIGGPADGEMIAVDDNETTVTIKDHGATNNLVPSGVECVVFKDSYVYERRNLKGKDFFILSSLPKYDYPEL
jgi:hypothetical protein